MRLDAAALDALALVAWNQPVARDRLAELGCDASPAGLEGYHLELAADGSELTYHYDTKSDHTGITALLSALHETGIRFSDLQTSQSSLEEIFVGLVNKER